LEAAFGDLPNFELIQGNALHQTADDLFAPGIEFDVVANLPYSPAPPSSVTCWNSRASRAV
jgi:16S rRNA A1518/A1519 N6-dimethyltransferase RsmA/KsgA/DIM1 with predicted DNA glycosylase/AP lyase activity